MKRLQVDRNESGEWEIRLSSGKTIPLYLQLQYPETEWPEVGSIDGAKEMHEALYDKWQTSDALHKEDAKNGKDGLIFVTPFGWFATLSFHVGTVEKVVAIANVSSEEISEARSRLQEMVMAEEGMDRATLNEIDKKYGKEFAGWPEPLRKKYWEAYHKGHETMQKVFALGKFEKKGR